ncbi:MAG: 23S rRNA pseudouridine(2604) synthase RluF [Flavobacteriales bacterium]
MKSPDIRLNKFISESGLCSRREADRFIERGNVFINGKRAVIGDQVRPGDVVRVNGHELEPRANDEQVFIALNKPVGVTSTTEAGVRDNIVQFVNHSKRIFPIGRLDKDSQGLIFLTNNGDLVNKILRAGNKHEKEYVVTVNKPLTDAVIEGMANGVPMLGVMTKKCKITQEAPNVFRIILVQGLNRQIRRMAEHFGYEVTKLERVRIMNISLKGIPVGDWRELNASEMQSIYKMIEHSSSESPKKHKEESRQQSSNAPKRKSTPKSKSPSRFSHLDANRNDRYARKSGGGRSTNKGKSTGGNSNKKSGGRGTKRR